MATADSALTKPKPRRNTIALWAGALALSYLGGKLAVDVAKWAALMLWAPAGGRLILAGYLFGATVPVVLSLLPAFWCWYRLLRADRRADVIAVIFLELAFLCYFGVGDFQRALADFAH